MNIATDFPGTVPVRDMDGYDELLESIRRKFNNAVGDEDGWRLYSTTATCDLYQIIIDTIPQEAQQHYNCNSCRGFVNRYGWLVTINPDTGYQVPVMWDPDQTSKFFRPAVRKIYDTVKHARVSGCFITERTELGTAVTGPWSHMAVNMPQHLIFRSAKSWETVNDESARISEDRRLLHQALVKYPVEVLASAVNILISGQISGGNLVVENAEWMLKVAKRWKELAEEKTQHTDYSTDNYVWATAANAPKGWCHLNSNLLGTLLDDLVDGVNINTIIKKFEEKSAPTNYQRPQAAPSAGAVALAEKRFEELGLAPSLKRRFAKLEEIPTIWTPAVEPVKEDVPKGIFADLVTKDTKKTRDYANDVMGLPPQKITWEKFRKTFIESGKVKSIDILLNQRQLYPFTAIVTAADMEAPPIILWDKPDERNPMSWYIYSNRDGSSGNFPIEWNLSDSTNMGMVVAKVTAITEQPNMWTNWLRNPQDKGIIFIIEDCRDQHMIQSGKGSLGLFPTNVRKDLYDIRSVIEAYNRKHIPENAAEATACGIILQAGVPDFGNTAVICVTTELGKAKYVIDRWE